MSARQQKSFLKKLHEELQASSEDYREETANKLSHDFTMTAQAIKSACVEAYVRFAKDTNDIIIAKGSTEWKKVWEWADSKLTNAANLCVSETRDNYFGATKKRKPKGVTFIERQKREGFKVSLIASEGSNVDIFGMIKTRYDEPLQKFFKVFEDEAKERLGVEVLKYKTLDKNTKQVKEVDASKGFVFQLEHMNFKYAQSSNIDLFIAQKFEDARKGRINPKDAAKFSTYLGLKKVIDPKKPTVVKVVLGSGEANRAASKEEGERRKILLAKIEEDLIRLNEKNAIALANLPGSDSPIQTERKKVLITLDTEFSKIKSKRVKTRFKENKKLDKSQKKTTILSNKPQIKQANVKYKVNKSKASSRRVRNNRSTTPNLTMLIGLLNKELPSAVAKNMETPRLNYRTGRFASSVRVTDIVRTPQGYPSIGYTYMKGPYQTFEPGYRQGSIDRDPRKLIDYSIREVAAQFAMGRFYTRRV